MTTSESNEVGRLAFRQEGNFLVAYLASNESINEARVLGSIHMVLAKIPDIEELFVDMMRHAAAHIIREALGREVNFSGRLPLPETERTGRA